MHGGHVACYHYRFECIELLQSFAGDCGNFNALRFGGECHLHCPPTLCAYCSIIVKLFNSSPSIVTNFPCESLQEADANFTYDTYKLEAVHPQRHT